MHCFGTRLNDKKFPRLAVLRPLGIHRLVTLMLLRKVFLNAHDPRSKLQYLIARKAPSPLFFGSSLHNLR